MMKELSMHILDIASNSVRGKADNITIRVNENINENLFSFEIIDDGIGIEEDILKDIKNPFTTTRTLRKVGLGIPLLEDTCTQCDGKLTITSKVNEGTSLMATMVYDHIDRPPMGDIVSTMVNLITSYSDINIQYSHQYNEEKFDLSTNDIKESVGDIPLTTIEIVKWLKDFLTENIQAIKA